MGDKGKLALTGLVAIVAVGVAFGGIGHGISFNFGDDHDGGAQTARTFANLKDFDGVTLNGPDNVEITRGDTFAVKASGDAEALKHLNIVVRDHVLVVERGGKSNWFSGNRGDVTVAVTMPALTRLALTGSGDMSADRLAGKQVKASLTGPGDLKIEGIEADDAAFALVGSGNLTVEGHAKNLTLNSKGSGNLSADDLAAEAVAATLYGSGNIAGHASRTAKIAVNGSGDIHVEGTNSCSISKQGSGDAECTS